MELSYLLLQRRVVNTSRLSNSYVCCSESITHVLSLKVVESKAAVDWYFRVPLPKVGVLRKYVITAVA